MLSYFRENIFERVEKRTAFSVAHSIFHSTQSFVARLLAPLLALNIWMLCTPVLAQGYPAPVSGVWSIKDFKFHTGEVLPELKMGYITIGSPAGLPVVLLHGTTSSSQSMLAPAIAGELFGPGQPLDSSKYFIILLDSIAAGLSSKPSDGLRMKFPHFNYTDVVRAQYMTVHDGLGIKHLRMVLGNSMGGMQTWLWGIEYPDFMDILVPMASMPIEMSGRNWMLRRLLIDAIKNDPDWHNGEYTKQPEGVKRASVFFSVATNGGSQALLDKGSTRQRADEYVQKLTRDWNDGDANDLLYKWESSQDFNPSKDLEKIKARVLAINSEDDERNPPQLGVMERELNRIPGAQFYLIPSSKDTLGHGTTGLARLWKQELKNVLTSTPLPETLQK